MTPMCQGNLWGYLGFKAVPLVLLEKRDKSSIKLPSLESRHESKDNA